MTSRLLLMNDERACCRKGMPMHRRLFAIAFMIVFLSSLGSAIQAGSVRAIENRWLRVEVDSDRGRLSIFDRATGQARVKSASLARPVDSVGTVRKVKDVIWGPGSELVVGHPGGWSTRLRLFASCPFVHLHTTVHNGTHEPYVTASLDVLNMQVDLGCPTDQVKSFGTGFLHEIDDAPGSFSYTAIVEPDTRRGLVAACLTHERGSGVFFAETDRGQVRVKTRIDFGRYQVEPGESRKSETLLVGYFEDARLGLEAYADAVAKQYDIRLPPQPAVYCTWYHAGASDERRLLANAEFAQRSLSPYGLSVMQIDDRWQRRLPSDFPFAGDEKKLKGVGPIKVFVEGADNYPSGMPAMARRLAQHGLTAGIWFMPFAGTVNSPYFADRQDLFAHWDDGSPIVTRWSGTLLDLSNPKTQKFVRERVRRIAGWGYRYFKLDGMRTGAVTHNVYVNTGYAREGHWLNSPNFVGRKDEPGTSSINEPSNALSDPGMTHIEAYRKGLQIVREEAPGVFILGCNVSQNMRSMGGSFGLIDAMRIGPDNGGAGRGSWGAVCKGARHGSNLYFLNGRVWHNDPDPVYVRPGNPIESARLMVSWVGITGSMLTSSYQFAELPPDRLDLLKRCMPRHSGSARPADLFDSDPPRIWLMTESRRGVRRDVIGLFNWMEKEPAVISYDMGRLGLNSTTTFAAFDFWKKKFVEPIHGTLTQTLPGGSCRVLAVRPVTDHPQLLSTSRHVAQCTVDVVDEHWDKETRTLRGRSKVVASDPYELRIALPAGAPWPIASATFGDQELTIVESTERGVRLECTPKHDGETAWSICFK